MTSFTTSLRPLRIMIVDDHPVFRTGLANLLAAEGDLEVVAAVASGEAAVAQLGASGPQVVLLDLRMPGQDGLEALETIHRRRPDVKVVVVTSSDSPVDADRARAAGAAGFLSKHVDQGEIVAAIRAVCHGAAWVQEGVRRPGALPAADALPCGISVRELEVLRLVRNGFANAEIGRVLGITERTVKAHVKALCDKYGAADRAEAVARGFDHGLLKTGE
jgi:DNA-binding NarL/FixJ family response regulator